MTTLADRVDSRMTALKIRQADLARACLVAPSSVAQWRNGHTKNLSGETLLLAAQALQCSPRWLATGKGAMSEGGELVPIGRVLPAKSARHAELVEECVDLLEQLDAASVTDVLSFLRVYAAKKGVVSTPAKRARST